jgi:hypothetical protein
VTLGAALRQTQHSHHFLVIHSSPLTIGGSLALQAVRGPGYRFQPLRGDLAFAPEAGSVRAICDPLKRSPHALESAEIGFDPADGEFTISSSLDTIQRVWSVFDGDLIAPAKHVFGAIQNRMEDLFEVSKFGGLHQSPSPYPGPDAGKLREAQNLFVIFAHPRTISSLYLFSRGK